MIVVVGLDALQMLLRGSGYFTNHFCAKWYGI